MRSSKVRWKRTKEHLHYFSDLKVEQQDFLLPVGMPHLSLVCFKHNEVQMNNKLKCMIRQADPVHSWILEQPPSQERSCHQWKYPLSRTTKQINESPKQKIIKICFSRDPQNGRTQNLAKATRQINTGWTNTSGQQTSTSTRNLLRLPRAYCKAASDFILPPMVKTPFNLSESILLFRVLNSNYANLWPHQAPT